MKISIIVPVYNVEKYLKRCIDSVISQSYKDIEIILVDDGSTDGSPSICDSYENSYDNIITVHKGNGGLSDARNTGLFKASGEYVLFIDSDDEIKRETCDNFINTIEKVGDADIIIGQLENEDGSNYCNEYSANCNMIYDGMCFYKKFYAYISPCAVASLYNRNFLITNKLFFSYGRLHEDCEFTPRVYTSARRIIYSKNSFYIRYNNENSISTRKDMRRNLIDILKNGYDLMSYTDSIKDRKIRNIIYDKACNDYLSKFYSSNVFAYADSKTYINKKFVWNSSKCIYNKFRALLFVFSPKIYCKINAIIKKR